VPGLIASARYISLKCPRRSNPGLGWRVCEWRRACAIAGRGPRRRRARAHSHRVKPAVPNRRWGPLFGRGPSGGPAAGRLSPSHHARWLYLPHDHWLQPLWSGVGAASPVTAHILPSSPAGKKETAFSLAQLCFLMGGPRSLGASLCVRAPGAWWQGRWATFAWANNGVHDPISPGHTGARPANIK